MIKKIPVVEAQNEFMSIIHDVENGPAVQLTRHGKPIAVLISARDYESLSNRGDKFKISLKVFRDRMKKDAIEITDADFEGLRDQSAGKEIEL